MFLKKPYSIEELQRKYSAAYNMQMQWASLISEAYKYVTPGRNALSTMFGGTDTGVNWETYICNSVAEVSAEKRANQLERILVPPNQIWGYFEVDFNAIRKNSNIDFSPTDQQNALVTFYRFLNASNLAQHLQSSLQDSTVSAGSLWIGGDDKDPLIFESIPGFTVMPEYHQGTKIQDLWYKYYISYIDLRLKYPQSDDLEQFSNEDRIEVIRGVVWDVKENGTDWAWRYVDLILSSTKKIGTGPIKLNDQYMDWKTLLLFRESVRPSELVGRGPGIKFLPEIKRLMVLTFMVDEAAKLRAVPIMEADLEMYRKKEKNNNFAQVYEKGTWGHSPEMPEFSTPGEQLAALTQRIEDGFSVNPIGGLNLPKMSATEVSARLDAAQQYTTIDTSRYTAELNMPLFENSFKMLLKRNLIPKSAEIREIMARFPKAMSFKYINPLGDIQKNNNMMKFQQTANVLQQYYGEPSLYTAMNLGNTLEFITENSGLPKSLFLEKTQMASAVAGVYQQAQQANQQNTASIPQSTTVGAQPNPVTPQGYAV